MLGADGTGLFNANWMQPGSAVVYVMPYLAASALPHKGENFVRLWRALGLHVFRVDVSRPNDTVVRSRLPWCAPCVLNGSLRVLRGTEHGRASGSAPSDAPCVVTRSRAFGCILSQDFRLSPRRMARLARQVANTISVGTAMPTRAA